MENELIRLGTGTSDPLDSQSLLGSSGTRHRPPVRLASGAHGGYGVQLPSRWIDSAGLESALMVDRGPFRTQEWTIRLVVPKGAALMVDAAVRLLSLTHQLETVGKRVVLDFIDKENPAYKYLNRIGFFDELSANAEVYPERPSYSAALHYRGNNSGLVEIAALKPGPPDQSLPARLERALVGAMRLSVHPDQLAADAFYLFSELIDNVYAHSESHLTGYAVLQVYRQARLARIAVTDSGAGLLGTLRPSLRKFYPGLMDLGSTELLVRALREGKLSRLGQGHGGGLKRCADRAVQLRANLEIRLAGNSLRINAKHGSLRTGLAEIHEHRPLIGGTHIVIEFPLD